MQFRELHIRGIIVHLGTKKTNQPLDSKALGEIMLVLER